MVDFAFGVSTHGIRVGGYHRDHGNHHGHHGHSGGNVRVNVGGYHSGGSIQISTNGGYYGGGGYDPTFAGHRALERRIITAERQQYGYDYGNGGYDPTFAGHRALERRIITAERRAEREQYEYDHPPVGAVPSYGRGSVGPRRESFGVRQEQELIAQDRINTPQQDEFPQEATGRPATDTQPKRTEAPAPTAQAQTPAEQPREAATPAGNAAEQKALNQKAQVYLELLGQETGQLDENGKRTAGAGSKKLKGTAEQTSIDAIASGFDGLVGTKTRDALRKAGLNPNAPITQETLDALAGQLSAERAKAEAQALPPKSAAVAPVEPVAVVVEPVPAPVAAAAPVEPVAAAVEPVPAPVAAVAPVEPVPAPVAAVAPVEPTAAPVVAAAPVVPAAQPTDIGVSAGGPPAALSGYFAAMQAFTSAPEASAPAQPAPVAVARPLTVNEMENGKALFLNTGVTGGQDVVAAGPAPTNVGQRPVSVASVGQG